MANALLTSLMQAAESSKRRLKDIGRDPLEFLHALTNRGVENTTAHLNKTRGMPYDPVADQGFLDAIDDAAFNAMTVYHGSPHKFDKFDMSKIGTGEGAQAYGHGLYFAENPSVAKSYKMDQYGPIPDRIQGIGISTRSRGKKQYETIKSLWPDLTDSEIKQAIEYGKNTAPAIPGNFYKVDIPDEAVARMLDWDKPLSEQAQNIRDALPNVGVKSRGNAYGWRDNLPMGEAYRQIEADFGNADKARQAMNNLGIPGIRYLDGGSRTAGEGTSNFVLFDDRLTRILERNGIPTGQQPWAPGEASTLFDYWGQR